MKLPSFQYQLRYTHMELSRMKWFGIYSERAIGYRFQAYDYRKSEPIEADMYMRLARSCAEQARLEYSCFLTKEAE